MNWEEVRAVVFSKYEMTITIVWTSPTYSPIVGHSSSQGVLEHFSKIDLGHKLLPPPCDITSQSNKSHHWENFLRFHT